MVRWASSGAARLGRVASSGSRAPSARQRDGRQRGQSIAEVAIAIPVALLLLMGAVDMGRLFFARVSIENAAREGAVFGAGNPLCDTSAPSICDDPHTADWHVTNEASGVNGLVTMYTCYDSSGTARGSMGDCDAGDDFVATVHDQFDFLTPLLTPILGGSMTLEATATAVVYNSAVDPSATFIPWPEGGSPGPSPSSSPPGACVMPDWVGPPATRKNTANDWWDASQFTGSFTVGNGNGNFWIGFQSVPPGPASCSISVTVSEVAP